MYFADLALVHHSGFSESTRKAAPGLLAFLRQRRVTRGHVVDLGCGDGTWLATLTDAGYEATGIDRSRPLLRYARQIAPRATLRVGTLEDVALPHCNAVTALGEVFNYLEPDGRRPLSLRRIFSRIHEALRPGGLLVFDVLTTGRTMHYDTWREARDWAVLVRVREQVHRRTLTRDIVTFRRNGSSYRRRLETHRLRVPTRDAVKEALRASGFTVRTSRYYGRHPLPPRRLAFFAQRREEH